MLRLLWSVLLLAAATSQHAWPLEAIGLAGNDWALRLHHLQSAQGADTRHERLSSTLKALGRPLDARWVDLIGAPDREDRAVHRLGLLGALFPGRGFEVLSKTRELRGAEEDVDLAWEAFEASGSPEHEAELEAAWQKVRALRAKRIGAMAALAGHPRAARLAGIYGSLVGHGSLP